jgi:uncharacterized protein (DUF2237 family)
MTGFFRSGCCDTNEQDVGMHTVCCIMTEEFLQFSKSRGNDLSTPRPEWGGLCAARWQEAYEAGVAPQVVLEATHQNTLRVVRFEDLKTYGILSEEPTDPSA